MAGCGSGSPRFTEKEGAAVPTSPLEGIASYYADEFHGRKTANGETYNMNALTAAHRTLPFNSRVRVTNRENGKSVVVRINDRGPFKGNRVIDLSLAAAKAVGMIAHGTAPVTIDVIEAGTQ
ncbi:septal ring lytic transglycosylase RlpA family protein [bacterium]|nr:MAG: septal ring lytic transglycosylase RlpA family protein [bacterium]